MMDLARPEKEIDLMSERERGESRGSKTEVGIVFCAGNVSATCCLLPICRDFFSLSPPSLCFYPIHMFPLDAACN